MRCRCARSRPNSGQNNSLPKLVDKLVIQGGIPLSGEVRVSGAKNAALMAAAILALSDEDLSERLQDWRAARTGDVAEVPTN